MQCHKHTLRTQTTCSILFQVLVVALVVHSAFGVLRIMTKTKVKNGEDSQMKYYMRNSPIIGEYETTLHTF